MKSKRVSLIPVIILLAAGTVCGQTPHYGRFIDDYAKRERFSGTIVIEDKARVRYARSFGYANRQFKVPNTNQTRFKIASITKVFTAALIMRLHEQGKLSLDQTIKTYLPNYTGAAGDKVTVKQLFGRDALSQMLTPGVDDYGYGVWVYEMTINGRKRRVVKRPGRIMGAQSMLFHLLNDNLTIVLLSNTDSAPLDEFAAEIAKRVLMVSSRRAGS
jgi:CubicO group peptidase (beta-lactamase class C family)